MAPSILSVDYPNASVTVTDNFDGKIPCVKAAHHDQAPDTTNSKTNVQSIVRRLAQYSNPALFVTPEHKIELRETSIPVPDSTQVLIHVRCTDVCGSDLHLWHRGAIGPLKVSCSSILGHEASGVVLATGTAVTHLKRGDKVAIEPGVSCMTCFLCSSGKYNLCESVAFAGVCPYAGTIRRFMVHKARFCHKLPEKMSFQQGALLEPLSVILHAVPQCKSSLSIGKPALICGAGPIGLIALAVAKASGAWPIVITDVDQQRLEFARDFSPGVQTYYVDTKRPAMEVAEDIRTVFDCGTGSLRHHIPYTNEYNAPITVLECTGVEDSVVTAAYCCRRGGSVMVVGVGRSIMNNLPFMHLSLAEIDLQFINRYRDTWPAGIGALTNHQVLNLDTLVTHSFPLHKAVDALELAADRLSGSIKVQIFDNEEVFV